MSNTRIKGRKAPPPPEPDLPMADNDDANLLKTRMASLKNDIFDKIEAMSTHLYSEIASVRQKLKTSIEPMK